MSSKINGKGVTQPKKKRTFTGCYTCRQRKIKCDNTRPTCQRCLKSKVTCLGYDINLRWSKPLTTMLSQLIEVEDDKSIENGNVTKRRNIEFMKFKKIYKFDEELDTDLNYCSQENLETLNKERILKGPFGIFRSEYFGLKPKLKHSFPPSKIREEARGGGKYGMITTNDSDLRSTYNASLEGDDDEDDNEEDTIEVWIDKKFETEALVTCFFIINETNVNKIKDMNKIIFAKYFELENQMQINQLLKKYRNKTIPKPILKNGVTINDSFNRLIAFFIENIHLMMPITFKGNIYETLIIPMIYQSIGQVIVNDLKENSFVLGIKKLILKQILCLGSFFIYESSGSEQALKTSINYRKEIMLEITELILKLTNDKDEFLRNRYVDLLITTYEIKNIVLVLILVIKIDYFVQILENFNKWFKLTDNLLEFLNTYNNSILNNLNFKNVHEKLTLDKFSNLKKLIKLYRFMKIFYFSTAKIDINNYELGNEEVEQFEDIVNEDYNLIKGDFIFDDGFNKIDDFLDILINKPQIDNMEDKPTFTINFNNKQISDSEQEDESEQEEEEEEFENGHIKNDNQAIALIDIPQPDNDTVFIGDVEDDVNKFSSIEYMYGLPLSLLELFNKIITLTNHKNFFTRQKLFPRNYPKLCCDLEEDLNNWKLTWKLFDEHDRFKSLFHEILYHNILSFYNSLCLYFERIIKESDPSLLQSYVRNSLKHLMKLVEIDDLDTKISPSFWSYFISSCDAIEPDLQLNFMKLQERFVGNNWISKQIILEVWKKRNEGFHQVCWLDIVKNWDCDVLLYS